MSNSSLVSYTRISPNSTNPRNKKISKITIHHTAGKISLQTLGNIFAPSSRRASSNYGVDSNGRVGLYADERNRAWTSGSGANDHRAVTIEVCNNMIGGNWTVSDKALEGTIKLCVDICRRNGIKSLNYNGKASGSLTRHNMFQNTNCPGPYLQSKFPYIEKEVNRRLKGGVENMKYPKLTRPPQRGSHIKDIQRDLNKLGHGLAVDGSFGPAMDKAVRSFQKANGLSIDGQYGPGSIRKMSEVLNTSTKPPSTPKPTPKPPKVEVDGELQSKLKRLIKDWDEIKKLL